MPDDWSKLKGKLFLFEQSTNRKREISNGNMTYWLKGTKRASIDPHAERSQLPKQTGTRKFQTPNDLRYELVQTICELWRQYASLLHVQ